MKAMATILLLIPYFGIAPYIYKFLIKHYFTWNICARTLNIFNGESTHSESDEDNKTVLESDEDSEIVEVSGQTIITNHLQEEKLLVYQV